MRTKEEVVTILAKKHLPETLSASTWQDLVSSISGFDAEQKQAFVSLVANGNAKKAGDRLKQALYNNAKVRAAASVEALLADDSLDLSEIDAIL